MICFDTTPFIWGMQSSSDDEATLNENFRKMRLFLERLASENQRIMIPTVVLAEYLVKVPVEDHAAEVNRIQAIYRVFPFDVKAASISADIGGSLTYQSTVNQFAETQHVTREEARQLVKVDVMIVATAIANNAERIISEDPHIRSIAGTRIPVDPIPPVDVQLNFEMEQE